MIVNGFKFQLPEIFLYFPANIETYSLYQYQMKSVEGVTWDMEGWLGLPLEEHWGASVLLTAPLLVILPPWLLQLHTSDHPSIMLPTSVCSVLLCWSHVDTGWLELPLLHSASAVITPYQPPLSLSGRLSKI